MGYSRFSNSLRFARPSSQRGTVILHAVFVRWCFSRSVGADRRVCPEWHYYRLFWADIPVRPYVRMFSTRIVGTRHVVSVWCYRTPSASLVPLCKEGQLFACCVRVVVFLTVCLAALAALLGLCLQRVYHKKRVATNWPPLTLLEYFD